MENTHDFGVRRLIVVIPLVFEDSHDYITPTL